MMKLTYIDNIPIILYNNKKLPLILNLNSIINTILDLEKDDELEELLNEISNKDVDNIYDFSDNNCLQLNRIFKNNLQLFKENTYFTHIINNMSENNMFGYVKNCFITNKKYIELFLFDDFTINLYCDNLFKVEFFEEYYWNLIETDFINIIYIFGGNNIKRRIENVKYYYPGSIIFNNYKCKKQITKSSINNISLEDIDYDEDEISGVIVLLTPLNEVFGKYDERLNIFKIYEDGVINVINRPFIIFESKNLAMVFTFAKFQREKNIHKNNSNYIFDDYNNIPISWDLYQ